MAKIHTMHVAKTQLSRLVVRASRGEEIVIARGSRPVARLIAIDRQVQRRRFGAMRGRARVTASFFEALPEAALADWGH
jgi:antitoxin (DNA-binding transcriptional repressor) of toxin-antitoxin stability system